MRSVFGANLGEIFVVGGIADMMVAVFNLPMAAGYTQQIFSSSPFFSHTGESIGAIITDFSAFHVDGDALNPKSLTQIRKVDAGSSGCDGDFAVFKTAMGDIGGVSAEGENPSKEGRSDCCGVFAGCL